MTQGEDPRFAGNDALRNLIFTGEDAGEKLDFWQAATAGQSAPTPEYELQLAQQILDLRGSYPAAQILALRGPLLSQAGSVLRGRQHYRANGPAAAVVEVIQSTQPFRGFFGVERSSLRHSAYAGGMSGEIRRELYLMADAVTVLPYDPTLDQVLVVEQFRAGPHLRGEPRPWQVEAVAGRIDAGETPEEAARREALEEAGITLGALLPVAAYYPSPGAVTEYLYSFCALTDLSQVQAGLYGLPEEGEDIRSHILPFNTAMAWITEGRIANGPLILTLFWLQGERQRLRAAQG